MPPPEEFAEALDDGLKGRLPVLLRLREFWEYLPPSVGASLTVSDLEEAIGRWVDQKRPDGLDSRLLRAHLAYGSALLVLDGMDEVPVGQKTDRRQVASAPTTAVGARRCVPDLDRGRQSRCCSRAVRMAFPRRRPRGRPRRSAPLQPLPGELQTLLAHRWFAVLSGEPQAGAETAADLFANIDSQPWLVELAANPLLLTAMCIVFDEGKRLPQDKHELYERVVATVLFSRYQDPADIDRVEARAGRHCVRDAHRRGRRRRAGPRRKRRRHSTRSSGGCRTYQELKGYTERAEAGAFDTREALLSHSGLFVGSGDRARRVRAPVVPGVLRGAAELFTVNEARLAEVFLDARRRARVAEHAVVPVRATGGHVHRANEGPRPARNADRARQR